MTDGVLRFAPETGGLFVPILRHAIRTTGALERQFARRYKGQSGIVFGFRGPPLGQRGKGSTWTLFRIEVDGVVVARDRADPMLGDADMLHDRLSPKWLSLPPGGVEVEIRDLDGEMLARVDVVVPVADPIIVAVMPALRRFGAIEAPVVWPYMIGESDRYHASNVREEP